MAPSDLLLLLLILSVFSLLFSSASSQPGFVSIDCGGAENYTDEIGLHWSPDVPFRYGEAANVSVPSEKRRQFSMLRYFPADDRKYCYNLNVINRTRYLVRASFLYGNFDNSNVYPKFDISLGATYWSTIVISDSNTIEVRELIFLASSPVVSVCLSNAMTGKPFISTLELRQFNDSLYYTDYETQYFLSLSARINFGAESTDYVRYPDDPFDRLWKSDAIKKANYLVDVAVGTQRVSTTMPVYVDAGDMPPQKVMQTAVVGTKGFLTYRMNLEGFPGNGRAFSYFAEIEDLAADETRKFKFVIPEPAYAPYSKVIVNVQENALGKYRLYEPGYPNISLPFILPFQFWKTNDSTRGPILNALEVYKYIQINYGSLDASAMATFVSYYRSEDWAQEGGDPCLPVSWSWVKCNSDPQPRVAIINLSDHNLTGNIPPVLSKLTGLVELWLDGNALTGPIPDLVDCVNLKRIHLENNQLTGGFPTSLASLPLEELYVQNNMLSGTVPQELLNKDMIFNFSGNVRLHQEKSAKQKHLLIIIFSIFGASVLVLAAFAYFHFARRQHKDYPQEDVFSSNTPQKLYSFFNEVGKETTTKFTLAELEEATSKFGRRVGSGGYGVVYYGKMQDGKEIAVKVLTSDTYQGNREFSNEVSLLSRIHHRNLVAFIGYCQQNGRNILVYEFMHNGTLKEHLYGSAGCKRSISWLKRLEIAEDAAKGIEYLHTGCTPTIIHRDVKSSNILLDKQMRAKVADFGLSKLAVDGSSHVSSIVRGTVGYLDPEYYISQQLTEKSDVYSFGVILLELISGQEAISNDRFGANCRNIVQWAKSHIESGDIQSIIDPALQNDFSMQSIWKIAEKAIGCVHPHGIRRPTMSEVLKEIQEAISIERGNDSGGDGDLDVASVHSMHTPINTVSITSTKNEGNASFHDSVLLPAAR